MEVAYRKDEVWLVDWSGGLEAFTILEIKGAYVRHKYGWETAEIWHKRCRQKLGTVRRILGVRLGMRR
jgi:hypothetical protein